MPNDSATVSAPAGSGNLAGTVSFALYPSKDCTGTSLSASGSFSWSVSYDSTNAGQRDIPASCHETSSLTIANGGTVSSP